MRRRSITGVAVALLAGGVSLTGAAVVPSAGRGATAETGEPGCGAAAPETLAQTIGSVAAKIYAGEVASSETIKDRHQVETYEPLLQAVARGDKPAAEAAVTSLVYSHTHIVRLRVITGSTVLADVGGPYILAPLRGTLRIHGRTVGRYVLSVQDDVGYVKIETRFIGAPIVLRRGPDNSKGSKNVPVEGLVTPGPTSIPEHGPVTYKHVIYQAYSFNASAFPSGQLRISVLVPLPAGLARESCTVIRDTELEVVARRIAGQFSLAPGNLQTYVNLVHTDTRGLLYVRVGSRQLAGSTQPGPTRLPMSGSVRYRRVGYRVLSFRAPTSIGMVRIYQLLAE